jgi:hypothetical protein
MGVDIAAYSGVLTLKLTLNCPFYLTINFGSQSLIDCFEVIKIKSSVILIDHALQSVPRPSELMRPFSRYIAILKNKPS